MIIRLQIEKLAPGVYQGHCTGESDCPDTHGSIADCLRQYGREIPPELAKFANIEYGGCHLETTPVDDLAPKADALADRLMALIAALHTAA